VIVRIATEGQYELRESDEEMLEELDRRAVSACEVRDEERFQQSFAGLLDFVRTHGRPFPEDELGPSDRILPPPDTTLEEARAEFTGEGLIPG
jgi:PspA-Associated protein